MDGGSGINELANVFQGQIKKGAGSPLTLEFGEIGQDFSLTTNTFPIPIPQTDYVVSRHLTLDDPLTQTEPVEDHTHSRGETIGTETADDHSHSVKLPDATGSAGGHIHDVKRPPKLHPLQPGDRVLVAWVQNDAVVVCIIVPATEIGG